MWGNQPHPTKPAARRAHLTVEFLEARDVPALGISGYAYHDVNNNGLRDPGESALVNSTIQLYNSSGQVIGTTTTDASGYYRFLTDESLAQTQQTLVQTLLFADGPTNSTITRAVNAFNPELGVLQRIEISINGRITSQIKAENLDPAAALIDGNVMGTILVNGPGLNTGTNTSAEVQTFQAGAFDGTIDFGGLSGVTFVSQTSEGTQQVTLTDPAVLAQYLGTGSLQMTVVPKAFSSAAGGGNLLAQISSSGGAEITVKYVYINSKALKAGAYRVEQPISPAGYLDGKLSRDGQVLPPAPTRSITVNYNGLNEAANNNFASVLPGSLAGKVYIDANNDGILQPIEVGISGVKIKLTGTNDLGQSITLNAATNASGQYLFTGLRPGTYTVTQTPPGGFLTGRINDAGTLGGSEQTNSFGSIAIGSGAVGEQYNFGWLKGATLNGYLYFDKHMDGQFGAGDRGVQKLLVTLTGVNDLGQTVTLTTKSNSAGYYEFANLRPGEYVVTQSQIPKGWKRGALNLGTSGGITSTNAMTGIYLGVGDLGRDYNFAFQAGVGFGKGNFLGSAWRQRP